MLSHLDLRLRAAAVMNANITSERLFSYGQMFELCGRRAAWKLLGAVALGLLLQKSPPALLTIGFVLLLFVVRDFSSYRVSWTLHEDYVRRFGSTYEALLSQELQQNDLETLIARRWLDLQVALRRHYKTKEL